jgi:hypothetical protein
METIKLVDAKDVVAKVAKAVAEVAVADVAIADRDEFRAHFDCTMRTTLRGHACI